MLKFKSFSELLEKSYDSDLFKICVVFDPSFGHRFWNYKDFCTDKFFVKITPDTYGGMDIDKKLPVLNYNSDFLKKLIKDG